MARFTRRSARGFTLFELMLVLVVLAILMAFAWPILGRPFAVQRLRRSADAVRTAWSTARNRAMDAGDVYTFTYLPGTSLYRIDVYGGDSMLDMVDPSAPGNFQQSATTPGVQTATSASRGEQLPDGTVFLTSTIADNHVLGFGPTGAPPAVGSAAGSNWSQPIYFYPDGTSSSARVDVASTNVGQVSVELRGLTGVATIGQVTQVGVDANTNQGIRAPAGGSR